MALRKCRRIATCALCLSLSLDAPVLYISKHACVIVVVQTLVLRAQQKSYVQRVEFLIQIDQKKALGISFPAIKPIFRENHS